MEITEQYLQELKTYFWENNLVPNDYQLERLAHFAELVVKKNDKVNLISRKDILNVIEKHVFISAFMSDYLPENVNRFLDIGTGGGFPGIPLAIVRPLMKGVVADSTSKKIDAVKEFIDELKLSNVVAENGRVEYEDFKKKYENSFDLIVSRSTVPLIILFRYAIPLIKNKAYIAAIKGGDLAEEFRTAEIKYKSYIKKSTIFDMTYKPNNLRNENGKKLVLIELTK